MRITTNLRRAQIWTKLHEAEIAVAQEHIKPPKLKWNLIGRGMEAWTLRIVGILGHRLQNSLLYVGSSKQTCRELVSVGS